MAAEPSAGRGCLAPVALLIIAALSAGLGWMIFRPKDPPIDNIGLPTDTTRMIEKDGLQMKMCEVRDGQFQRATRGGPQTISFRSRLEVSATEVTFGQFRRYLATKPEEAKDLEARWSGEKVGSDPNLPVVFVDWGDAAEFCNWLSRLEGKRECYSYSDEGWKCNWSADGYRLPTSAEWEYAARAGSPKLLPVPGEQLTEYGWFRQNAEGRLHEVGKLRPNARQLLDVWGNAWEWCWDWYSRDQAGLSMEDPTGPPSGLERTVWGGGWNDDAASMVAGARKGLAPEQRANDVGFRVVRSLGGR